MPDPHAMQQIASLIRHNQAIIQSNPNAVVDMYRQVTGLTLTPDQIYVNLSSAARHLGSGYAQNLRAAMDVMAQYVPECARYAGAAAGSAAAGVKGVLGALAANALPILAGVLIVGAIVGAVYIGVYWGEPESQPVQAGWRTPDPAAPPPADVAVASDKYLVIRYDNIISVRTERMVNSGELASGHFRHGGLDMTPLPKSSFKIEATFDSADEATEYVAGLLKKNSIHAPPLADGWVGKIGEQVVTLDDWSALSLGLLFDKVGKGFE